MDHTITTIFVSLVTLWALFGDDIRLLVGNSQNDTTFYVLTLICFSIFTIEIILSCYAKSDYLNSFYFYLDVISTVTLLFDVGWISDSMFSSGSSGAATAKVGTKATRLIRILRLIRLIRIVKLYKAAQMHREKKLEQKRKELLRQKALIEKMRLERSFRLQQLNLDEDGNPIPGLKSNPAESLSGRKKSVSPMSISPLPMEKTPGAFTHGVSIDKLSRGNSLSQSSSPLKGNTEMFAAALQEDEGAEAEADLLKESNVNKTLSSNINKIVIILILFIMLSVPLFDTSTYISDSYTVQAASFSVMNK